MNAEGRRAPEGRISEAFVGIYSHNKDLVGDTWAGCVYIKGASQHGAAASSNTSGNTAGCVRVCVCLSVEAEQGDSCIHCFFLGSF